MCCSMFTSSHVTKQEETKKKLNGKTTSRNTKWILELKKIYHWIWTATFMICHSKWARKHQRPKQRKKLDIFFVEFDEVLNEHNVNYLFCFKLLLT